MPRFVPVKPTQLVTVVGLAAMIGCHRNSICRWVATGLIPSPARVGQCHVWTAAEARRIARSLARLKAAG